MSEPKLPDRIWLHPMDVITIASEHPSENASVGYILLDAIQLPKLNTRTNKDELRLLLFISEHKRETLQDKVDVLIQTNNNFRESIHRRDVKIIELMAEVVQLRQELNKVKGT